MGHELLLQATQVEIVILLRHAILRPGLAVETAHFDCDEAPTTRHFAAFRSGGCVACLSLMDSTWPVENQIECSGEEARLSAYQLRGMAVAEDYQGQGVGGKLLTFALTQIEARPIWCNARLRAIPFYQRHGFAVVSEVFDVPSVGPHRKLLRD